MEGTLFDEQAWFGALDRAGIRVLLIGRRACVLYGLPLLTGDYDVWVSPDDIEVLNRESLPFGLLASLSPDDARARGRYVLENDEHVDVICARVLHTTTGEALDQRDVWQRRHRVALGSVSVAVPALADLIATKRVSCRARDLEDIRALQALAKAKEQP